jgi:SPP1 family phage portal protein
MIIKGRRKINTEYNSEDLMDLGNLARIINVSMQTHKLNKADIEYLINYSQGVQPILDKTKIVREEINNTLVINHAQMVTRTIMGYFLGTPIQYIQNGASVNKDEIDMLNRYVAYEDKASVDKELAEYQSICGTAYRIIYTDGIYADEVPFEDKALEPQSTFVVYENSISEKPVLGVTYHNIYNNSNLPIGVRLYAYTDYGVYTIETNSVDGYVSSDSEIVKWEPYDVGGIPIIEYPNNIWRLGDWELCLGLMDAINSMQSSRLDDVDQIIQSLLVFVNAEIDETEYDSMRKKGIISLKNMTGNQSSVDTINTPLDQNGINLLSEELEALLYALIGIPDRNNRSGGGGDTGQAVELRDGWADLEILARNKELTFKKSEKLALRIILNILKNKEGSTLSLMDVDIKFSRNKNNNLLVKAQSYSQLLLTKTLSPEDCLTIVDLVSDVAEYVSRGKLFWKESFGGNEPVVPKVEPTPPELTPTEPVKTEPVNK